MGFLKGALKVGGKILQGTAYVASEIVRDSTGIDFYGTAKDVMDVAKSERALNREDIVDRNTIGIEEKKEDLFRKRAELLKKALPNYPDEKLLTMDFEKFKSIREIEVYKRELMRWSYVKF